MSLRGAAASVIRATPRALQVPWHIKAASSSVIGIAKTLGQEKAFARKIVRNIPSMLEKEGKSFHGVELQSNDVLAACAGKMGTHWLMQIQYQIAWRGEGEFAHIHDVVPWPDGQLMCPNAIKLQEMRARQDLCPTGLNVIKTHLPASYMPASDKFKAVTIHRNPVEAVASGYPFFQRIINASPGSFDAGELADWMLEEDGTMHQLALHAIGFWQRRNRPNYLFINYADIKRDPRKHIQDIAALMQVDLTNDQLDKVVERSSIGYMKKIKHRFQVPSLHFGTPPAAVRHGQSGNAEKELGRELAERIRREAREIYRKVDPEFPYDEVYGK